MKIITVCGSLKFQKEMMEISEKPVRDDKKIYTKEEIAMFDKMHKEKIKLSNAILVVNVDGYIGESTKSEIEYAKALDKEIIYYTDIVNNLC